ncbi:MvdC/MvdD family ATP grasp protein [Streptomyces sp. NPDC006704]|uniref:MvdC/MvdD family ATP grasp protein n=1 Tax=Streptomyces sp. NPDC006704 TaxID=3364760 RepID=UPI0036A3686D
MTVLVLTCAEDVTADMVVDRLNRDAVPVLRLDPADFPGRVGCIATMADGQLSGCLTYNSRILPLAEIRSVWVRRPGTPDTSGMEQSKWMAHESAHALYGTLRCLPRLRWMNHPDAQAMARYKIPQLRTAEAVGLNTVPTVVTTDPRGAEIFADLHGPVVCKAVSGRQPDGLALPTTPIPRGADFSAVAASPTCLQQSIEKVADIRLTVVGDSLFCAMASSTGSDVRFAEDVRWQESRVPEGIAPKVAAFMKAYGLSYGAFDFLVDADGEWWFLECNPAGQFGFIELATGQPISWAIADHLARTPAAERLVTRSAGVVAERPSHPWGSPPA